MLTAEPRSHATIVYSSMMPGIHMRECGIDQYTLLRVHGLYKHSD